MLAMYCSTAWDWTRRALPPDTRHRVDAARMIQLGWRPARSIGNAAGIAKFPLRAAIGASTILVDNDESSIGQRQAIECSDFPRCSGNDLNEIVRKWAVA